MSLNCDDCGEELWPNGVEVYDGATRTCPCGIAWMVSADRESDPYIVRCEDIADEEGGNES